MKLIYTLLLSLVIVPAVAQNANFTINIDMQPGTLVLGQTGVLKVTTCNLGTSAIVANSLRITISAGITGEILGIDQSTSDSRWTLLSLTNGANNTIRLSNTGGTVAAGAADCASINLIVKGVAIGGGSVITATIGYISAVNPVIGAPNSSQGNTSTGDDNALSSLAVTQAMPVHLLGFSVQNAGNYSVVKWKYDNAINFSHFELEKSKEAVSFKNLYNKQYTVSPKQQAGINEFAETDASLIGGDNYYRLKMVDIDGSFTYSYIVKINFTMTADAVNMAVFPNPVTTKVTLTNTTPGSDIALYDMEGKQLQHKKAAAGMRETFDLSRFSNGEYIIRVAGKTIVKNFKVVKQ